MSTSSDTKPRKIKPSELFYKDYSDRAVPGDDPSKTKEDADRFSREEKYEVIDMRMIMALKIAYDLNMMKMEIGGRLVLAPVTARVGL
jgi:hypothetical protein